MITVMFYGDLRQFGTRFKLHVSNPAEAIRALTSQIKGLKSHLENGSYQVRFNGRDYSEDEVLNEFQQGSQGILHIVPRVAGAGKWVRIVVGVILIVVGYALSWTGIGLVAGNLGVALVLGGIAELLTKQPKLNTDTTSALDKTSTSFTNLANTQSQGVPVPLVYGKVMCGTRLVSQGVESYDVAEQTSASSPEMHSVFDTTIQKVYTTPVAATDPFGTPYKIDADDDSVRAANYTAKIVRRT